MADENEDYFLPVEDQRVFGAGIRRKKITFVPASSSDSIIQEGTVPKPKSTSSSAERYLSIVLPKSVNEKDNTEEQDTPESGAYAGGRTEAGEQGHGGPGSSEDVASICPVCKLPLPSPNDQEAIEAHESSIAHQLSLEHSHPPSHLDREHVGLRYLTTYGWDPDSRKGLGARQEGITIPIKPKEKKNTAGLRETAGEDGGRITKRKAATKKEEKVVRLNAKQVRLKEMEMKKKAERLRRTFYGPSLEQYLGLNS
ncbi:hypothetical protein A1O1_09028 [Capronia coronata CBS 617.96]|uniref:G-patch domain-containing protein n=1 Tax=Capronia coronata CBS 617.96 TaxID=1182541 RepID=W9XDS3_9EURO|nr:uncharacterized protein A1O1_09028 [Capronia coronata CBS 617.96]EXJ78627.1 hypothetical protein A1O1_09028 [Capronia coronata CBS 617.96]